MPKWVKVDPTIEDELAAQARSEFDMEDFLAQNDHCVMCRKDTQYKNGDHIDYRRGYIEGFGQMCADCETDYYKKHKQLTDIRGGM